MFLGILVILATVAAADRATSQDWHVNPRGVFVARRHAPRRQLQTPDVPHQKHKSGTASAPQGELGDQPAIVRNTRSAPAAVELGEGPPDATAHVPHDPASASKSVTTGDEQKVLLAPDAESLEPNDDVPTDEAMQSRAPSGTQQNLDDEGQDDVSELDDDESSSEEPEEPPEEPEAPPQDDWEWIGSDETNMDRSSKIGFTMFASKDSKGQDGKRPKKRNEKVKAHTSQKNVGQQETRREDHPGDAPKSRHGREKTITCADGTTRQCAAGSQGCDNGSPKYCGKAGDQQPKHPPTGSEGKASEKDDHRLASNVELED